MHLQIHDSHLGDGDVLRLQVHLIDDVKYQSLRLAGAPPTRDQLGSCLASDAGLSYQGTDQTTIALPIVVSRNC